MTIIEGWASTPEQAEKLLASGEIKIEPNHHHNACGPMAGTISGSYPVYILENKTFGNRAYSRPADLQQQFGNYSDLKDNFLWRDVIAPALSKGLRKIGGVRMAPAIAKVLEMGDESHNRNNALTSVFVQEVTIGMVQADVSKEDLLTVLKWYAPDTWAKGAGVRACIGLAMATAKAMLDPVMNIEYSTVVTCMCRNGYEFGLRVSALGDEWFTAPAPVPDCKYFPPYTREDSGRDMGDSAITETAGWGCFVLAGALAFLNNLPVTPDKAYEICKDNAKLCVARSPVFKIPAFGFEGTPTGIDVRRVVGTGIEVWINTGVAHKNPGHGVIGRGLTRAPMECFTKALHRFAEKYGVTPDSLLLKP